MGHRTFVATPPSHQSAASMLGHPRVEASVRVGEDLADTGGTPLGTSPSDQTAPFVVAVEATQLAREVRGVARYLRALLPQLVAQRPGLTIDLFVNRRDLRAMALYAAQANLLKRVNVRPIGEMRDAAADMRWYPWNTMSDAPDTGAVVVTVHDLAPLVLPDPRFTRWWKNRRWQRRYATVWERR